MRDNTEPALSAIIACDNPRMAAETKDAFQPWQLMLLNGFTIVCSSIVQRAIPVQTLPQKPISRLNCRRASFITPGTQVITTHANAALQRALSTRAEKGTRRYSIRIPTIN
jgi:hypothetical protein